MCTEAALTLPCSIASQTVRWYVAHCHRRSHDFSLYEVGFKWCSLLGLQHQCYPFSRDSASSQGIEHGPLILTEHEASVQQDWHYLAAPNVTNSMAEVSPYEWNKPARAITKELPTFPVGTRNRFLHQLVASAYRLR